MADARLRRNLEKAFDPGPGFPNPLLLSRTIAALDAEVAGFERGQQRKAIFPPRPRRGLAMVAALLLIVLAAAAIGIVLVAKHASNQSVPAGSREGTIVFGRLTANGDEELFTVRPDGTGERRILTTQGCCSNRPYIRWSHHGDRLLLTASVTVESQNLVTAATVTDDGSGRSVLPIDSPGLNLGPGAWSPDDKRLALEGWDDADASRSGIYTADATNGGNRRRVTTSGDLRDIPLSYSPDGSKILFRRGAQDCGARGDLFVVRVDGAGLTQVNPPGTTVTCNLGGPGDWSRDGSQVSFAAWSLTFSLGPGTSAVFVAAGDGTNPGQITAWDTDTTSAHWSPSQDWIVFDTQISESADGLFLVHADGSGLKAIPAATGCCAVWSPAGHRLLFRTGPSDPKLDLWTVGVDGSHLTRLTHTPADLADVSWGGPSA